MRKSVLKAVLTRLAKGRITRAAAAEQLRVSTRHVNRLMLGAGVTRPRSQASWDREDRRSEVEAKRWMIADNADQVVAGRSSAEDAAINAGVSLRTMQRWVAEAKKTKKTKRNQRVSS